MHAFTTLLIALVALAAVANSVSPWDWHSGHRHHNEEQEPSEETKKSNRCFHEIVEKCYVDEKSCMERCECLQDPKQTPECEGKRPSDKDCKKDCEKKHKKHKKY